MRAARWQTVAAPLALGVVALALWQLCVTAFAIRPFVIPGPLAIAAQFGQRTEVIWTASLATATNALVGLVAGTVIGTLFAMLAAAWRPIDQLTAPIVTALAVVPIVALAPVFYAMFGAGANTGRQLIAAIAVFTPVYFNVLRGLRQARPIHRDLMRAYAATAAQTTRAVTLPAALPFFFTGLRIASSLAVISALVAEYFGGPVSGLGKAITSAVSSSNYPLAWAFVLGAILTGLVFYCATYLLEYVVMARRRVS
ncbi:ABC transporter permease [Microbacterium sp. RG1]|uniref:ABC transporter permease n=1 Tax=Microbacterium sp. RG1 TaxID=2489212 RepID=UPI0010CA2A31|nr:ABC transporter permease subunit [Microbacterium sp. RG1]QCQ17082.1 ABC transporter permease subunit [Microbacterium sp. RG1]